MPDQSNINVGPQTKVSFMGAALVSFLAGLCFAVWTVGVGIERFNQNLEKINARIDERVTQDQLFDWSLGARAKVPELPLYVPKRKD